MRASALCLSCPSQAKKVKMQVASLFFIGGWGGGGGVVHRTTRYFQEFIISCVFHSPDK